MSTRREFLAQASFLTPALCTPQLGKTLLPWSGKKVLILGGTRFLGPHLVETCLAAGHEVTLFNRGKSNPGLFPRLETLIGDRDDQLDALKGRKWDYVIDTSGYFPRHVRLSAELLAPNVDHYVFISTVSVYSEFQAKNPEDSPLATIDNPLFEEITGESYGPLKALCEMEAIKAMEGRCANLRPGLIVGPLDNSDRFNYWCERIPMGGEVLAPGSMDAPKQVIDARDLANFALHSAQTNLTGAFNCVGPKGRMTMAEVLYGAKISTGADCSFTWVNDPFLTEHKVGPWMELPLWIPETGADASVTTCVKAQAAGLVNRPVGDTIKDTAEWLATLPNERPRRAGMTHEREKTLLQLWKERS